MLPAFTVVSPLARSMIESGAGHSHGIANRNRALDVAAHAGAFAGLGDSGVELLFTR